MDEQPAGTQQTQRGTAPLPDARQYPDPIPDTGNSRRQPGQGKKPKWPLFVILAVIILALAAGAYFIFFKPEPKKDAPTKTDTTQNTQQTPVQTDGTIVEYKSDKLGLELSHRKDWALAANGETGAITLTSPVMTYATKDGSSKQGTFVLRLAQGADTGTQSAVHNAFASRDSETIAYTAPLETQRYYTNVTIGGPSDGSSFFIITGPTGFKANDPLSAYFMNGDTYVFMGGFGSFKTDGTPVFETLSKNAFNQTEGYTQAVDIIKSLKIH